MEKSRYRHLMNRTLVKTQYFILVFLSVARIILLFALPLYGIHRFIDNINTYKRHSISQREIIIYVGILLLWCLIKLYGDVVSKREEYLRNIMEFDDEGMNKKYNSLQKLSKAEREAIAKQKLADMERLIGTGTLQKMTKAGSIDPDKELGMLKGLKDVKQEISEMAARMEFDRKSKNKKLLQVSSSHMCFIGPPGTGKTTCAKIMTGFLYKYGYIKENTYIETDGNFLRGQSMGETSEKTALLLSLSKGKVLFIDEAYALFTGEGAQEAIATIIKAMEDNKDEFVLILAGYEHEMAQLINGNPGFFSRLGHILYFGDYTNSELYGIFKHMAKQYGFRVNPECQDNFIRRINREKEQQNFGNARTCRNILNESISKHALNLKNNVIAKENVYTLCPEDIKEICPKALFYK